MAELTEQQKLAVECRAASVVLASGAGCGKTHVLTERYLDHLRSDGALVGQLLAITFTDRAARQMRQRIRKAITDELHHADDTAAERWARHLRTLESAHISTIHSFCAALLRQHAVEAGLDPAFEVLEEVLAVNLRQEARTQCLQGLLTSEEPLGDDLRELIILYGWDGTLRAVESLMEEWQPGEWHAWLEKPAEQVAARWQEEERRRILPGFVDYLVRGVPKIAGCLRLLETTPCLGPLMQKSIAYLLAELPRLHLADDLEAAVQELNECAKVGKERGKAWASDEVYQVIKEALEGFRGQLRDRMELFIEEPEGVVDAVIVGQRFLRVAAAAARAYRQRKHAEGVVDFQDLLSRARDLLRSHPEVRAGLQERYRFILVDELQDTDPLQHELVAQLCGDCLTAGKLFAVGDHQQSIYRFRGAAVELFTELRQRVPEAGQQALSVNFRSQPGILDFANALFARHLRHFQALEPFYAQANPGACVEFLWSAVSGQRSAVSQERADEANRIARRIRQMLDEQELLVREKPSDLLRPVRSGDITLLFRSMSNVGIYEAALRGQGIDYYLVGGRAFFAQQEIYDLLHLLRALENPRDELSLAGTLRSPFCCLSDEALLLLSRHREGLWAGLHDADTRGRLPAEQRERAVRAGRFLDRWRTLKDRLPIARLIGEVFAHSGYDAAMQFEVLGERQLANLWKLQELARTIDRNGRFGLAEFIARLDDLVSAQPREEQAATQPENADVVRIMSIHQAKGLEFPVVVLPDLGSAGRDPRQPTAVWHPTLGCVANPPKEENQYLFSHFGRELWKVGEAIEDWHEELRTLYVACTRAEDYLILSASLPDPFQPENAWMLLLSERFDLATGECKDASIGEANRPRVKVSVGELRIADRGLRIADPEAVTEMDLAGVAPIPIRIGAHDVVTVAGLEAWRRARREGRQADVALLTQTDPPWVGDEPVLEEAVVVLRDLEYVLKWSKLNVDQEPSLFAPAELPGLRGRADILWQDQGRRWHLVGRRGAGRSIDDERCRLAIAAKAVEQQTGALPASVSLYENGKMSRILDQELRQPKLLGEIEEALIEMLEQRWTPAGMNPAAR